MGLTLGVDFSPNIPVYVEPVIDEQAVRQDLILAALANLSAALQALPAPQVHVASPDLSAIVNAVTQLKSGVSADEIAAAVVKTIAPTSHVDSNAELVATLKKLEFRLRGDSRGGSAITPPASLVVSNGTNNPVPVTILTTNDSRSLTERMSAKAPLDTYVLWLDVTATESNHIYVVEALAGSLSTDKVFRGTRVTLDVNGNPLGPVQIAGGFAWDSRSTATWTP